MLFFPVAFSFLASQCTKKETKCEFRLATLGHIKIKPIHYITSIIYNAVAMNRSDWPVRVDCDYKIIKTTMDPQNKDS